MRSDGETELQRREKKRKERNEGKGPVAVGEFGWREGQNALHPASSPPCKPKIT